MLPIHKHAIVELEQTFLTSSEDTNSAKERKNIHTDRLTRYQGTYLKPKKKGNTEDANEVIANVSHRYDKILIRYQSDQIQVR